jgi:hypothetical protein
LSRPGLRDRAVYHAHRVNYFKFRICVHVARMLRTHSFAQAAEDARVLILRRYAHDITITEIEFNAMADRYPDIIQTMPGAQ